jgi:hypothetical protein
MRPLFQIADASPAAETIAPRPADHMAQLAALLTSPPSGSGSSPLAGLGGLPIGELARLFTRQGGGVNPYTYGMTGTGQFGGVGDRVDSAGNLSV